jgi:hypothetical protein
LSCGGYHSDWNSCRPVTVCIPTIRYVLIAPRITHTVSGLRLAPTAPSCRYMMACYLSHSSRISTLILMITGGVRYCCMPVRWSGLGIRRVVSLAPSAYMASAASTAELTSSHLPTPLREVVDSGVHGNRHVGLDHADFLSVNIVDSCYILLPGSFIPIPSVRSLRPVKTRGRGGRKKQMFHPPNDELACFN